MRNSAVDVKVDEPNDGSTARQTKYWADEPHGVNGPDLIVQSEKYCYSYFRVASMDENKKNIKRLP